MEELKEHSQIELCDSLWKLYEPQLRKYCSYKLSSHPSEVDDVISETYFALCKAISNDVDILNPKAWLYGTLNNQIKLKYSELKRIKKLNVSFDSVEHELLYNIDFDTAKLSDELIEQLQKEVVNELSESEKVLISLIYEKKTKYKDIATIIGSTESAVKQKHYRLKKKIKSIVKTKMKKYE